MLIVAVASLFACGNALSIKPASDRVSPSDSTVIQAKQNVRLRGLKASVKDNDNLDEERAIWSGASLTKLVPGSAAYKAAQAAKTLKAAEKAKKLAEQKQMISNWYKKLLERDDFLYDAMKGWRSKKISPNAIHKQMLAVGRTDKEASTIYKRFNLYKDEMKAAGK
ncbi:RxLR effector protein [Phytophthora megakarya]|uniref:RxLR effector protein n=1 Tax=Phytophthora megakarya TaxID=4795 RepID=A0A225VVW7_9STRA|nr:RxLR effector protein [Phytophthora megakarya]